MNDTSKCTNDATRLGVWPAREKPLADTYPSQRDARHAPVAGA